MPKYSFAKLTKYFLTLIVVFGFWFLVSTSVEAQVMSVDQLKIDTSVIKPDSAYSVPTQIVVAPIFPPQSNFNVRDIDWYRGLYYFSVANNRRPGFTDIPFHYIVSRDGRIFQGNSGGEERKISIQGIGDGVVVIGYLAGKSDNAVDPRAKEALGDLIVDVASRNSIPLDKVTISGLSYVRDDKAQNITINKQDLFGLWNTDLHKIIDAVRGKYAPISKTYAIQISGVTLPTDAIKSGEQAIGKLKLKNIGKFGIYPDTTSELFGTKANNGTSIFYLPNYWVSTSQFALAADDKVLLPGQEKEYEFRVNAPLYFGEQAEDFVLKTAGGQAIVDTAFKLKLNITKPAATVVEVKPTITGWLRVRATPSGAAPELSRISQGERFIQTGDQGNGWVKLRLNDGREGWVSKQYLTYL
jgi:hypothetical protein